MREMVQATGPTFKTIEKMRTRIYAAADTYDGPSTFFGCHHCTHQQPCPEAPKRNDSWLGDPKASTGRLREQYGLVGAGHIREL